MASAARDTTCAEFWTSENATRGDFTWGAVDPARMASFVARAAVSARLKPAEGASHLNVLVAGAGRSRDAPELRLALQLPAAAVIAADFDADSVRFQTDAGVTGVLQDMVTVVNEEWVGSFDIVYDASFLDVFMSDWHEGDDRSGVVHYASPNLKAALRNLFLYLRPGGMLVVKSIIASAAEFDTVWRVALCGGNGKRAERAASRARVSGVDDDATGGHPYEDNLADVLGAAELRRMAMEQPGKRLERSAYTGRLRTSQAPIMATGHVGAWLDHGPRSVLQARLDAGDVRIDRIVRAPTLYP